MTDYTKSQKQQQIEATEAALAEFLARGGKVQVVPAGKSGYVEGSGSAWGRKKKTAAPIEAVEAVVEEEVTMAIDEAEVEEVTGDEVVFTFDDDEDEKEQE
jgi:hypothetical protein